MPPALLMPPFLKREELPPGKVGIISGSGLNLERMLDKTDRVLSFSEVPGLSCSTVQGHASRFLLGTCAGVEVVVQSGRLHSYEGLDYKQIIRPVEALHAFGVRTLVCTNAVGALSAELQPGALLGATRLNTWPCQRFALPETLIPNFVLPGCDAYGEYWWMHGPCYETRAEVRALKALGGLSVGMSVAPELNACVQLGLKSAVVSCATNNCVADAHITHEKVLAVAQDSAARLCGLLKNVLQSV